MSTGYGWEGIRQVCATLLGSRHMDLSASAVAVSILRGAITNVLLIIIFVYCRLTDATEQKILPQQAEISGIIVA